MSVTSVLNQGEIVTLIDPRLFNVTDLAQALGVKTGYIRLMKRCGFKMPGGRASVKRAHDFLNENPDLIDPAPAARKAKESVAAVTAF